MNQAKVGKLIEEHRKAKGLTQQQLAEILGVSNTAISKWENGNNLPDILMLEPLSEALDMDMLELIESKKSSHQDSSKRLTKVRKTKFYRNIAVSILFLGILCITNIFTYSKVMSKRKEHVRKSIEVYKISSKDKDFIVEGYFIFNDKENMIFIENIIYQGDEEVDIDFSKIESVKHTITHNDSIILSNNYKTKDEKIENVNSIINIIEDKTYTYEANFKEIFTENGKTTMNIKLNLEKNKKYEKEINLSLNKLFI